MRRDSCIPQEEGKKKQIKVGSPLLLFSCPRIAAIATSGCNPPTFERRTKSEVKGARIVKQTTCSWNASIQGSRGEENDRSVGGGGGERVARIARVVHSKRVDGSEWPANTGIYHYRGWKIIPRKCFGVFDRMEGNRLIADQDLRRSSSRMGLRSRVEFNLRVEILSKTEDNISRSNRPSWQKSSYQIRFVKCGIFECWNLKSAKSGLSGNSISLLWYLLYIVGSERFVIFHLVYYYIANLPSHEYKVWLCVTIIRNFTRRFYVRSFLSLFRDTNEKE